MIICILVSSYFPSAGGVAIATRNLACELATLGHDVHVITSDKIIGEEPDKTLHVHRILIPQCHKKPLKKFFRVIFYVLALIRIRTIYPDVIHVQRMDCVIPAYLAYTFYNIPYCLSFHGPANVSFERALLPKSIQRYWSKLPYIKYMGKLVVLTNDDIDMIMNILHKEPMIIPNGVNQDLFHPSYLKPSLTKDVRIICVSRFVEKKGLEDVVRAIPKIIAYNPNVKLTLVGDGELRPILEQMVIDNNLSSNVEFTGFIPQEKIGDYYRDNHIFVSASLSEGLSLSMLEAIACGLPIIVTPTGGQDAIVNKWNNGRIIPFQSPDEITRTIIEIIDNPTELEIMSKNSIECSKEYTWQSVAKKYHALYQELSL